MKKIERVQPELRRDIKELTDAIRLHRKSTKENTQELEKINQEVVVQNEMLKEEEAKELERLESHYPLVNSTEPAHKTIEQVNGSTEKTIILRRLNII